MSNGKLNREIEIQEATLTGDGMGGKTKAWANLADVWAEVIYVRGHESVEADRKTPTESILIRIHFRSDITNAHRILFNGNRYDIRSVQDRDGKRKNTHIEATREI
jgi:SPP1 family predicted phage head-tail adaptor